MSSNQAGPTQVQPCQGVALGTWGQLPPASWSKELGDRCPFGGKVGEKRGFLRSCGHALPSCSLAPKPDLHQTACGENLPSLVPGMPAPKNAAKGVFYGYLPEEEHEGTQEAAEVVVPINVAFLIQFDIAKNLWEGEKSLSYSGKSSVVGEVAARSPRLTGTHPCAAGTDLARGPSLSAQPAPKAADVPPLCAIPHEKAPQRGKELALSSHWGRRLSSPQEGFAVGSKGCERLSCHGNRSAEDPGPTESNRSTSIPLLWYGQHLSTARHPVVPSMLEAQGQVTLPWVGAGSHSWKLPGAFPLVEKRSMMLRSGTVVQPGWGRAQ